MAATFLGAFTLVLFWAVAWLLGLAGLIASIVGFTAWRGARRDAVVGLATSLIAVALPILFVVWVLRNVEWGW